MQYESDTTQCHVESWHTGTYISVGWLVLAIGVGSFQVLEVLKDDPYLVKNSSSWLDRTRVKIYFSSINFQSGSS